MKDNVAGIDLAQVGQNIKVARQLAGIDTQEELAERIGCSSRLISQYETISAVWLDRLIHHADVDHQIAFLSRLINEVRIFPENKVEIHPTLGLPVARATLPKYFAPRRGMVIGPEVWSLGR